MKRQILTALLLCLAIGAGAQQVMRDDFNGMQVSYTVGTVEMQKTSLAGRQFVGLGIEGCIPSAEVGAPSLPLFSYLIEVPLCEEFEVVVSDADYDTISVAGMVTPAQPSRSKSEVGPYKLEYNEAIYSTDEYYGDIAATVEPVGIARDRRLARLQFSPIRYNPVRGSIIVCRKATVTVHYRGADREGTLAMFERYHSPAFNSGAQTLNGLYPKSVRTAAPVRYLIVAHSMFRGQMDNFVQWKRRKGFITDIVYTDDAGVGTTSTAIQSYIQNQYTNATAASPAPTYLLIVGDHEQIPAFSAQVTSPSSDHITDLYYSSWTSGDHIPDCYCGRFSAQNVSQLTPQIEKTLMYEQYTFADPSFLDRAVMVAGVDNGSSGDYGYTHADPAMDYAITNYINGSHGWSQVKYFKNNTSIVPTGSNVTVGSSASSNSSTVRDCYNQGAGWINYSAHGNATCWGTPSFTTSNVAAMTNTQKFGIMIGNCCLTNKFETTTCLGESLLRKGNYCGAVGYIGGSNSTYWNEDFYWAVGLRSGISPTMSMAYNASNLGAYDRINHTHNEAYGQWVKTQGELMFQGNMAVEGSSSNYKYYYWEIYHLMGDPSLMPYLTQASEMTLTAPASIPAGTSSISVTAAPYAYVALTDTSTHTLKAAAFANASGQATLTLTSGLAMGGYEVVASAQQYRTAFQNLSVVTSSGPYAAVVSVEATGAMNAGSTVPLTVKVVNQGNSIARNVVVAFSSGNTALSLNRSSVSVGSIAAGDTATISNVTATVGAQAVDQSVANITATTTWTGNSTGVASVTPFTLNAAQVAIEVAGGRLCVMPGNAVAVNVTVSNSGHAALGSTQLTATTGSSQLTASVSGGSFTLAAGASVTRQVTLTAAASMEEGATVPVYLVLSGSRTERDTLEVYIGEIHVETFEGGFTMNGWTQGTYPWEITTSEHSSGNSCARSCSTLSHSQTSEMTLAVSVATADSVSFWYKVSSESNYDKFHFYIDGTEKIVTSGQVDWTRAAYLLAAGDHLLKFTYSKDVSVSSYSDCAWVDEITLPRPVPTYVVNVSATNGTPTGAGTYAQGETATVGVYPNAGYAFVRWNDGNTVNPRQFTVTRSVNLTATLSQGGVTTVHDTTYVPVHDTSYVTVHDTSYVTVHDTAYITVRDTSYITVHDTSFVTLYDTTYVTVHDTSYITVHDTAYIAVHDTTFVSGRDTLYVTQFVHDTTFVTLFDTAWIVQYLHDTAWLVQYVYDTAYVIEFDTVTVHDTLEVPFPVNVLIHDTTVVELYVHDTAYVHDTLLTVETIYSTDTIYVYDTLYVYDTVFVYDTVIVHDTVYVPTDGIGEAQLAGARIYQRGGHVVVESIDGVALPEVVVYDVVGRRLTGRNRGASTDCRFTFAVPASGVYLVKVGDAPACRVSVVR